MATKSKKGGGTKGQRRKAAAGKRVTTRRAAAKRPKRAAAVQRHKQRSAATAALAAKRPVAPRSTPEPMRALAQRIVDLTLAGDDEGSLALYADIIESSEAGGPPGVGLEALRKKYAGWRDMVSDTAWEPRHVFVDGNAIIIEWTGHVTFKGSGRLVDMSEVAVHEVEGGKIVRERFYYDRSALQ